MRLVEAFDAFQSMGVLTYRNPLGHCNGGYYTSVEEGLPDRVKRFLGQGRAGCFQGGEISLLFLRVFGGRVLAMCTAYAYDCASFLPAGGGCAVG